MQASSEGKEEKSESERAEDRSIVGRAERACNRRYNAGATLRTYLAGFYPETRRPGDIRRFFFFLASSSLACSGFFCAIDGRVSLKILRSIPPDRDM